MTIKYFDLIEAEFKDFTDEVQVYCVKHRNQYLVYACRKDELIRLDTCPYTSALQKIDIPYETFTQNVELFTKTEREDQQIFGAVISEETLTRLIPDQTSSSYFGVMEHNENIHGSRPNFTNFDFSGFGQEGNFTFANIQGANFTNADHTDLVFRSVLAQRAKFLNATLRKSDFRGANLRNANFQNANLWHSSFIGADLRNANFQGADLDSVDFRGADLRGIDFSGINISSLKLDGATIDDTLAERINNEFLKKLLAKASEKVHTRWGIGGSKISVGNHNFVVPKHIKEAVEATDKTLKADEYQQVLLGKLKDHANTTSSLRDTWTHDLYSNPTSQKAGIFFQTMLNDQREKALYSAPSNG